MGYLGDGMVPWVRAYFPYPGSLPISADGFLKDPEEPYPRAQAQTGTRLVDLIEPVILIVGESGIGKTQALRAEQRRLQDLGRSVTFIDLSGLDGREAGDDVAQALREVGPEGVVLIDGLDQTNGTFQSIARGVRKALIRHEAPLPRLRFAAITGSQWPVSIDQALPEGLAPCAVYQLAPLTAAQARQAASVDLPDPDEFMRRVAKSGIGPLAAHPLSLRLVLQAHRKGQMPRTRADTYRSGIAGLVDGPDDRATGNRPPTAQILKAARRLAAVTALSGTTIVHRQPRADHTGRVVDLEDIATSDIALTALHAVIDGGLMRGNIDERSWFHRSIEEYLCAEQLQSLPKESVAALLGSPAMPQVIPPQLLGVTAWLASTDDAWFEWALERRYELLFNPDLRHRSDDQRRRLGATLIESLANDAPPYDPGGTEPDLDRFGLDYTGLLYPELGEDLAPLLAAGQPAWRIKEVLLVVIANGLRDLDANLVAVIEDIARRSGPDDYNADIQAATWAAIALRGSTDSHLVNRGTTLLRDGGIPWVVRTELARWLWPTYLTTADLHAAIPPGGRRAGGSAFARALIGIINHAGAIPTDQDADLLQFIATMPPSVRREQRRLDHIPRLVLRVLSGELNDGTSWEQSVTITAALLDEHALPDWPADALQHLDDERRRRFAAHVAARAMVSSAHHLVNSPLTGAQDALWWAQRLAAAQDRVAVNDARLAEAVLSSIAAAITSPAQLPAATRAAAAQLQVGSGAAAVFNHYFSAEACQERTAPPPHTAAIPPPLTEQLLQRVGELLGHDDDRVLDVIGEDGPANLQWHKLSPDQQEQLADQARRHMLSPQASAITADGRCRLNAAHSILSRHDPKRLTAVTTERWLAWLPTLIGEPDVAGLIRTAIHRSMGADPVAAEQIVVAALTEPTIVWHLHGVQTPAISAAALDLAEAGSEAVGGRHLRHLLMIGATHQPDRATLIARGLLRQYQSGEGAGRDIAVHAAAALAAMPTLSDHFAEFIAVLRSDATFAAAVIRSAASDGGLRAWTGLTPEHIGELFLWADTTFRQPLAAPGVHISTDPVPGFADHLVDILSDPQQLAPTTDPLLQARSAVATLRRLAERTGYVYLRQRARRLEDTAIAAGSTASVTEILAVLDTPELRRVRTREEFVEVLLGAIDNFAIDVRRDRAMCALAWHRQRPGGERWSGTWVPKEENEISTWLTRELRHYLRAHIALFREVEISPRLGSTPADRPDIIAVALQTTTVRVELNIVIEVKGNWHPDVTKAFGPQLADRYLTGPLGGTGIYLVAYFAGDVWDSSDRRYGEAQSRTGDRTPAELQQALQQAANVAVTAGRTIDVRVIDFSLATGDLGSITGHPSENERQDRRPALRPRTRRGTPTFDATP
ncbi:NACHT domain-containing protein [Micromonospora sp. CPCC 205556]|uniref:NACHT domain-containing protein n=1 Tax=Micromonospora sp. CPCC 205556 TaxID=3122398 RepID=UPI002FEF7A2C